MFIFSQKALQNFFHPPKFSRRKFKRARKNLGEQGISLYLSIIIMVILLAIVLGTSGILLGQLKMMKGIENSVIAFYAADTGIERILVDRADPEASSAVGCTESNPCELGDAKYYLEVKASEEDDCSAANFCISSVGIYKGTQRAIQVSY